MNVCILFTLLKLSFLLLLTYTPLYNFIFQGPPLGVEILQVEVSRVITSITQEP